VGIGRAKGSRIDVIVTCQQCATQFHLDDTKVPKDGIRVRCSRCKFAFLVESPQQSDFEHGASVARDSFASDAGRADEAESDWQFSEDIDSVGSNEFASNGPGANDLGAAGLDAAAAAAAAVDDLLGKAEPESEQTIAGSAEAAEAAEFDDPASADGRDAFDLGSGTDGSEFGSDGSTDFDEVGLEESLALEAPDEVHDDLSIPVEGVGGPLALAPLDGPIEPVPGDEFVDRPTEPLTDPGERSRRAVEAPDAMTADVAAAPPTVTSAERGAEPLSSQSSSRSALPYDLEDEPLATTGWIRHAGTALGWALTTSLCVAALFVGFFPRTPATSSEAFVLSIAGFEAQAVRGSWIDNAVAGPIYVVSGSLRAETSVPATGSELRVRMLDDWGEPLPAESAAVGPPIPTAQLRESSPRDLRDRQVRESRRFIRQELAQGERRPFHAVLGSVPPAAAAFEFWAADGASAQAPEASFAGATDAAGPASAP
jgi:predicted Zn finger-like uncharacterized protein